MKYGIAMKCLICDDYVNLTPEDEARMNAGLYIHPKVCDKCREAILKMRESMEVKNERDC